MKASKFYPQVQLLLDVLPYVAREKCFALKGGTAINLFVRDFPRLSVDIDLTYLGNETRDEALKMTEEALRRIQDSCQSTLKVNVHASSKASQTTDSKLFIGRNGIQIKVEANPVMRGTLHPVQTRSLMPKAIEQFEVEIDISVSSLPDLYGGKIAAALDRQHPRDLFDIRLLFENEGLTTEIKNGFLVYLLCHKRPPHEIIKPTLLDQSKVYASEFVGMSETPFSYQDFESTRQQLTEDLAKSFTPNDKNFLISFFRGQPSWELFPHPHAQSLPAIQWKLQNLGKMSTEKRETYVKELNRKLRDVEEV